MFKLGRFAQLFLKMYKIFFLVLIKFRGENTFIEVKCHDKVIGKLTSYTIMGYSIEICCQKKQYRRRYDKWFVSDKDVLVYRVFSIVSSDVPEEIKKLFRLDLDIPAFLPSVMDDDAQCHAAIRAYVDILLARVKAGADETGNRR